MTAAMLANETQKTLGLRGVYGFRYVQYNPIIPETGAGGRQSVAFQRLDSSGRYIGLGSTNEEAARDAIRRGGKEPYAWVIFFDDAKAMKKFWSKLYTSEKEKSLLLDDEKAVAISTSVAGFSVMGDIKRAKVEENVDRILLR